MSIIHEALKKSGQPVIAETGKAGASDARGKAPLRPQVEVHRKKASVGWGALLVLGVLVLATTPMLAPFFFNPPRTGQLSVSEGQEVPTARSQFALEEMPLAGARHAPAQQNPNAPGLSPFELTGLVYSNGGSYCLINGKVVKQGERVGNAVVERIEPDGVVLDLDGEKVVLPVTTA